MLPFAGFGAASLIAFVAAIMGVGTGAGKGEGPWSELAASKNSDVFSNESVSNCDDAVVADHFAFSCNFIKNG